MYLDCLICTLTVLCVPWLSYMYRQMVLEHLKTKSLFDPKDYAYVSTVLLGLSCILTALSARCVNKLMP